MSTLKKHKVVMLPTEKASDLCLYTPQTHDVSNNILNYGNYNQRLYGLDKKPLYQHLYILSDEEIKIGDWGIGHAKGINGIGTGYYVFKHDNSNIAKVNALAEGSKKIIATTDTSLWEHDDTVPYPKTKPALPQPSQAFIEKYVEEYNKGNIITKVIVEYESVEYCRPMPMVHQKYYISKVKINPKDNTITIKKVKDSWSREEVIDLLTRYNKRCQAPMVDTKWISENL